MYEVIKNAINNTEFDLRAIIGKIDIFFTEDKLSEEERNELISLARSKAKAENSYASVEIRIENLYRELTEVKARLYALENKDVSTEGTEQPTEPAEEYPEFVQPTGAQDCYNKGEKITFKGIKKICNMNGCVWSPDVYPAAWDDVVENAEEV